MTIIQKTIRTPESGSVFFVGDLHGCFDLLQEKLIEVGFDQQTDILIACGDLVDRGPDSLRCLRLLDEPWFFSVLGNHEQMMIDAQAGTLDMREYALMGGAWFTDLPWAARDALAKEVGRLPLSIEVQCTRTGTRAGIVHADCPDHWGGLKSGAADLDRCIWSRERFKKHQFSGIDRGVLGIDLVVCGHTFTGSDQPLAIDNVLFIDTGAYLNLQINGTSDLTVLSLEEAVIKVKASRQKKKEKENAA